MIELVGNLLAIRKCRLANTTRLFTVLFFLIFIQKKNRISFRIQRIPVFCIYVAMMLNWDGQSISDQGTQQKKKEMRALYAIRFLLMEPVRFSRTQICPETLSSRFARLPTISLLFFLLSRSYRHCNENIAMEPHCVCTLWYIILKLYTMHKYMPFTLWWCCHR